MPIRGHAITIMRLQFKNSTLVISGDENGPVIGGLLATQGREDWGVGGSEGGHD